MLFRRSYESILDECLDALRHGVTVEDCLARYPRHARKLAPQLQLAAKVARTPLVPAGPAAKERAWQALQRRTAEIRAGKRPHAVRAVSGSLNWVKPAGALAIVVLGVSLAGGGLMYAAQDAQPDGTLYGLKLAGEDLRVRFIFDDAHKADVLLDQSRQRMEEINDTIRKGDPVPENALSAMLDRNQQAEEILQGQPSNTTLRARMNTQAQEQEERLLAIWPQVPVDGRPKYTEVVANLHNVRLDNGLGTAQVSLRPEELSGGILTITGQAELGSDNVWRIGGVVIGIDDTTLGFKELQSGTGASVLAARSSNGRLHALSTTGVPTGNGAFVSGAVEQITDDGITVAGQFIPFNSSTLQTSPVKVGEKVQITLSSNANGLYAGSVNQYAATTNGDEETLWFEGTIQGDISHQTNEWKVGGTNFEITPNTSIDASAGLARDGARVQIEAVEDFGQFQARRVVVLSSQADGNTATVIGTFDGYDANEGVWTISGMQVVPPDNPDDPPRGSLVAVSAKIQGADLAAIGTCATCEAIKVIQKPDDAPLAQIEGTISAIDNNRWTIGASQVRVSSTASAAGTPEVGKRVIVWATKNRDGDLEGTYARILDQSPVVTPAPGTTPSPTPYDITGAGP